MASWNPPEDELSWVDKAQESLFGWHGDYAGPKRPSPPTLTYKPTPEEQRRQAAMSATPTAPAAPAAAAAPTKAIRWEDTVAPAAAPAVNTRDRVRQAGNMARKYGSVTEFNDANVGSTYNNIPDSYASNNFSVMPSKNFVQSGYNDAAVSGALKAAAARGDWGAVGRFYASQGQPFARQMYDTGGAGDLNQLYRTAMGLDGMGPQSYRKRDRAAELYGKLAGFENVLQKENLSNTGALSRQELMNKGYLDAQNAQNAGAYERENLQQSGLDRRLGQTQTYDAKYKDAEATLNQQKFEALNKASMRTGLVNLLKEITDGITTATASGDLNRVKELQAQQNLVYQAEVIPDEMLPPDLLAKLQAQRTQKKANGGLVEGYARGGEVQPVLNPMGNMGMPSSMADLDPVVRQYAQYVSTASQYGLQPVAFPKFIDLLGSARTQLASLPTQGGATGFADGGPVNTSEDDMYYVKQFDENGNFTGYTAYPRQQMPNDSAGRPSWVPQETWDKNNPSKKYANGGVVDWLKGLVGYPQPAPAPQTPQQRLGQGVATLGGGMAGQAAQAIQGRNAALEEALGAARSARMGYADGGIVGWLKNLWPTVGPLDTPAPAMPAPAPQTSQQQLGQGAAMLGSGMAGQAAQTLQGRRMALEEALSAAQGARGYAGGGAIPVAGRQVLGAGGPTSDSIPAVIDGQRPAALSSGEYVFPTEAVQFYGTDKLNKMIQKARGQ